MSNNPTAQNNHLVSQEILRAITSIQYGSVEIVIHDNQIVQIECRKKIRIHHADFISRIK